jgi:hypothetical protein
MIRGFNKIEGVSSHGNILIEGFFTQQLPCHTDIRHWKQMNTQAVLEQTLPLGLLQGTMSFRNIVNY